MSSSIKLFKIGKERSRGVVRRSRLGFQRLLQGPKPDLLLGSLHHRSFQGFSSGINKKKLTTTPFKVIGLKY